MHKSKIIRYILVISVIISGLLLSHTNSNAYTEEQIKQAKAWLSAHGYSPSREGAYQAYADYKNGKLKLSENEQELVEKSGNKVDKSSAKKKKTKKKKTLKKEKNKKISDNKKKDKNKKDENNTVDKNETVNEDKQTDSSELASEDRLAGSNEAVNEDEDKQAASSEPVNSSEPADEDEDKQADSRRIRLSNDEENSSVDGDVTIICVLGAVVIACIVMVLFVKRRKNNV